MTAKLLGLSARLSGRGDLQAFIILLSISHILLGAEVAKIKRGKKTVEVEETNNSSLMLEVQKIEVRAKCCGALAGILSYTCLYKPLCLCSLSVMISFSTYCSLWEPLDTVLPITY